MNNSRYLPMVVGIFFISLAVLSTFVSQRERPEKQAEVEPPVPADQPLRMQLDQMRVINRDRLRKLNIGMTKEEVTRIMGERTFYQKSPEFIVPNPYRIESYLAPDGTKYELQSYYSDLNQEDQKLTKDEMTPLMFENGKLIGWGWIFVEQLDLRHTVGEAPPADTPAADLPLEK